MEKREQQVVALIKRRFGARIDLDASPMVIVEILREFGPQLNDDGGGGGGGGVSPGTSTVAVGITPPESVRGDDRSLSAEVLRILSNLRSDLKALDDKITALDRRIR